MNEFLGSRIDPDNLVLQKLASELTKEADMTEWIQQNMPAFIKFLNDNQGNLGGIGTGGGALGGLGIGLLLSKLLGINPLLGALLGGGAGGFLGNSYGKDWLNGLLSGKYAPPGTEKTVALGNNKDTPAVNQGEEFVGEEPYTNSGGQKNQAWTAANNQVGLATTPTAAPARPVVATVPAQQSAHAPPASGSSLSTLNPVPQHLPAIKGEQTESENTTQLLDNLRPFNSVIPGLTGLTTGGILVRNILKQRAAGATEANRQISDALGEKRIANNRLKAQRAKPELPPAVSPGLPNTVPGYIYTDSAPDGGRLSHYPEYK